MTNPSNIDKMKQRITSLEQENMRLSERAEDSQILAFISQLITQAKNKDAMLDETLEHISMLKNIPIVACCQWKSGVAEIVQSYLSYEHRDLNQQSFPCHEAVEAITIWEPPEQQLSALSLGCTPSQALLIPFSSQYLGTGFYMFVVCDEAAVNLEYLSISLERITDLLTLSLDHRNLLKSYRFLNEKLESKVQERTQSLRDSQEKYQSLVDSAALSIMLFDFEHFVEANPATLSMFQCPKEIFFQLTPMDLSPQYQEDGRLSYDKASMYMQQAIDSGSAHFDWLHQRWQGDIFPCEVHLSRVVLKGKTMVQAVIVDLSERVLAQKQLTESEARYRSIIENIPDFLYRTDAEGVVTFVAPSVTALLGYSMDELMGQNIQNFYIHPTHRERLLKQLDISETDRVEGFQVELRHKQGHSVWLSNHVHKIYEALLKNEWVVDKVLTFNFKGLSDHAEII